MTWLGLLLARIFGPAAPAPPPAPATPPPPAPPPVATPEQFAAVNARMVSLHNDERSRNGLAPLSPDGRLAMAALLQARDCARRNLLTHTGSDGSDSGQRLTRAGYAWSRAAENAAQQPQAPAGWPGDVRTPEWAMDGWMQSPGHRANILGPYTQMGAGWADAADGTRYWVVDFGSPR